MHVKKREDVQPYVAPKHHGMTAFRLQGQEATPTQGMWVGYSIFLPGGGAETSASPIEKVYVVLEGEITVVTRDRTVTLSAMDSCLIEANEDRSVENRSKDVAKMLVISPK